MKQEFIQNASKKLMDAGTDLVKIGAAAIVVGFGIEVVSKIAGEPVGKVADFVESKLTKAEDDEEIELEENEE